MTVPNKKTSNRATSDDEIVVMPVLNKANRRCQIIVNGKRLVVDTYTGGVAGLDKPTKHSGSVCSSHEGALEGANRHFTKFLRKGWHV